MDDKGITDQLAVKRAVNEMADLLEESNNLARKSRVRTSLQYAFMLGSVIVGMTGGPLTPIGIGGAFISIGQFLSERLKPVGPQNFESPTALFRDIRKRFGWK